MTPEETFKRLQEPTEKGCYNCENHSGGCKLNKYLERAFMDCDTVYCHHNSPELALYRNWVWNGVK